jgi:hypothetical protein
MRKRVIAALALPLALALAVALASCDKKGRAQGQCGDAAKGPMRRVHWGWEEHPTMDAKVATVWKNGAVLWCLDSLAAPYALCAAKCPIHTNYPSTTAYSFCCPYFTIYM